MANFSVDGRLVIQIIQFLKFTSMKSEGQTKKKILSFIAVQDLSNIPFSEMEGD